MNQQILIKNARYYYLEKPVPHFIEYASLVLEDGFLTKIIPAKETTELEKTATFQKIIDATGMIILPGLTNGHTHVAMNFLRGLQYDHRKDIIGDLMWKTETQLSPELVSVFAQIGIRECLLTGTTQIIDHYYFCESIAEACVKMGIRGFICEAALDLQGPLTSRKDYLRTFEFSEKWHNRNPLVQPVIGPHAPNSVSSEKSLELARFAKKKKLPLHFHLAQSRLEYEEITSNYEKTPVQLAYENGWLGEHSLAAHCIYVSDDDIRLLQDTHTSVAYCPSSQIVFATLASIQKFQKAGINTLLSTDCVASADHMSMLREIQTAIQFNKYLTPFHSINFFGPLLWSTQSVQKWFPHKSPSSQKTDLIICDMEWAKLNYMPAYDPNIFLPLHFDQLRPKYVLVNGEWSVWDFKCVHINEAELMHEADKAFQWMAQKVGLKMPLICP